MNELDLHVDHITLSVADLAKAKAFYERALAPIGLTIVAEFSDETRVPVCGFGIGRKGSFWLVEDGQQRPQAHFCFRAKSRVAVRAFYDAAICAGGTCNGPPGPREIYHPAYYAAFVLDLEGHNAEVVTFEPESST